MDEKEKKFGEVAGAATAQDSNAKVNTGTAAPNQQASSVVNNTMQTLKEAQTTAPTFSSDYDTEIKGIYDQIVNRPKFSYDYSTDPIYGQYKEQYVQQGKQAMKDTMGQAAALTGGYGSSYGQAVGQQTYDDYITRLNEMLPTLYNQAYTQYENEGDRLNQQYSLAADMRNTAYGTYRDQVGDQQYADAMAAQQATDRAALGDWEAYRGLYGDAAAKVAAIMQNPQAAWAQGIATADEVKAYTGSYPAGYQAPGGGYYGGDWNPDDGGDKWSLQDVVKDIGAKNYTDPNYVEGLAAQIISKGNVDIGSMTKSEAAKYVASYWK